MARRDFTVYQGNGASVLRHPLEFLPPSQESEADLAYFRELHITLPTLPDSHKSWGNVFVTSQSKLGHSVSPISLPDTSTAGQNAVSNPCCALLLGMCCVF